MDVRNISQVLHSVLEYSLQFPVDLQLLCIPYPGCQRFFLCGFRYDHSCMSVLETRAKTGRRSKAKYFCPLRARKKPLVPRVLKPRL